MSFASLLKKKINGNEDVISILDETTLMRDAYDFDKVRERVTDLKKYADKDIREDDEFMKLFFSLFNEVYADRKRSSGVFHPSGIMNACERQLYYEFAEFTPSDVVNRKIDGRLQRIFDTGTFWHTYVQMLLWKAGILEKSEVRVVNRRRRISGSADGIVRLMKLGKALRALLEIKTMNSFSYAKGKLRPKIEHEVQAGVYARELKLDWILFLYVNKDTSEITAHLVEVNNELVDEKAYGKMDDVLDAVTSKVAPDRVHCTHKMSPMAKVCPYASLCFKHK